MKIINRARDILSNKTGGGLKETVLAMAKKVVAETLSTKSTAAVAAKMTSSSSTIPKQPSLPSVPRSVTPRLRREILNRDRCCQYRDKDTGKICGSTRFLEVDHVEPRFAGGSNAADNLRVLCKNHNSYRYRAELQM